MQPLTYWEYKGTENQLIGFPNIQNGITLIRQDNALLHVNWKLYSKLSGQKQKRKKTVQMKWEVGNSHGLSQQVLDHV